MLDVGTAGGLYVSVNLELVLKSRSGRGRVTAETYRTLRHMLLGDIFSKVLEMQKQAERADSAGEDQVRSLLSTITSFG